MIGGFGENFPYSNFHDLNMDWIIKIAKDFLDQYTNIQNIIEQGITDLGDKTNTGLEELQAKYENLSDLLDSWYNEHSEDIANQLASALDDLNTWYTTHEGYLDQYLTSSISAFNTAAEDKARETIETIPDDYTAFYNKYLALKNALVPYNTVDVFDVIFNATSGTANGVTFTWDTDHNCSVSGTATGGAAISTVCVNQPVPNCITPNKSYLVNYVTSNTNVQLGFVFYKADNSYTRTYITEPTIVTIPDGTVRWSVRLYVENGLLATGNVTSLELIAYSAEDETVNNNRVITAWDNILSVIPVADTTLNGLTFKKTGKFTYEVVGTASSTMITLFNIFYDRTALPYGITAGKTYHVYGKSKYFNIRIISFIGSSDSGTVLLNQYGDFVDATITIPENTTGIAIRLQQSLTANTNYTDRDITICFFEKDNFVDDIINSYNAQNKNAKIWCLGNSFMNGAVWENNNFSHFTSYEDSIYGQIAIGLNIPKINNEHELHSSTGLLSAGADGSFNSIITSRDITPFDYLVTQFNGSDIDNYNLGTINSTDSDGTLAGAVIHIANYIKTNNALCQLIILGVPPYSATEGRTGQDVFTGNWGRGYSINDLDNLMYDLSKKYHFSYISWQDLEMSYHYMDFADYTSGQTGPRHAKYDRVYRTLGEFASAQLKAVNSPIALGKII